MSAIGTTTTLHRLLTPCYCHFFYRKVMCFFSSIMHIHIWLLWRNVLFVMYNNHPGQQDPQISCHMNKYGTWWSRNLFFNQSLPQTLPNCDNGCKNLDNLSQDDIRHLWPARSPDLSPYEQVRDMMKRELILSPKPATTIAKMRQRVQEAWDNLSQDDTRHLWPARSPDLSPYEHVWDMMKRELILSPKPATTRQWVQEPWDNLSQDDIRHLWPARSPDLSPYEQVWDMMKREPILSPKPATTIAEIWQGMQDAWDYLSQDDIRHLYDCLYVRIRACVAARGGALCTDVTVCALLIMTLVFHLVWICYSIILQW